MDPLRQRRSQRPDPASSDSGFVLLESIVSMGLVVIMMAGLTTFFVNVTGVTNVLRNKQNATMFADQTVDRIRAMQPSDTYVGRSSTSVNAQWTAAPATVSAALVNMTKMSDDSGSPIKLAASQTQVMNGVTYTAQNYLGSCAVPVDPSDGTACTTSWPNTVDTANYLRVVVGVSWTDKRCSGGQCTYVTTTLLSTDSDPNFLLNQTPPAAPVHHRSGQPDLGDRRRGEPAAQRWPAPASPRSPGPPTSAARTPCRPDSRSTTPA